MTKDIKFELLREDVVRDKNGDIEDWLYTIVAESNTIDGLIRFARLKKLDKDTHAVEQTWKELYDGLWTRESKYLGHLNELV